MPESKMKPENERVTLSMDAEVSRRLRVYCALRRIKMSAFVENLITTAIPPDFEKAIAKLDTAAT